MKKKEEPKLGLGRVVPTKKEGSKVKAFFDVIVPSPFNGMVVRNFKIVEGTKGLFISLPSRPGPEINGKSKYYNDIRFESPKDFENFKGELDRTILPAVKDKLEKIAENA